MPTNFRINWHQEEVITKLAGPKIKLPSNLEQLPVGSDNGRMSWTISADPNISDPSIPEDILELMKKYNLKQ
jgi:hypothetical protein